MYLIYNLSINNESYGKKWLRYPKFTAHVKQILAFKKNSMRSRSIYSIISKQDEQNKAGDDEAGTTRARLSNGAPPASKASAVVEKEKGSRIEARRAFGLNT